MRARAGGDESKSCQISIPREEVNKLRGRIRVTQTKGKETEHTMRPRAHRWKKGVEEERTSSGSWVEGRELLVPRCESLACKKSRGRAAVASA